MTEKAPSTMALTTPPEVLAHIFSFLEPQELDTVPLVCRQWRQVANDTAWKAYFARRFGTAEITKISPDSSWRKEVLTRLAVLHKWLRTSPTTVSYNSTLAQVTDLFADFPGSRVITFNRWRGIGALSHPRAGRVGRQRLYATRQARLETAVAAMDGGRFAVIHGFQDGGITTTSFVRSTHHVSNYNDMPFRHEGAVTSVWVSKTQRPIGTDSLSFLSAGEDGVVYLMFGANRDATKAEVSSEPIAYVQGDPDHKRAVALDKLGRLFLIDYAGDAQRLATVEPLFGDKSRMDVVQGFAVIVLKYSIVRVDLANGEVTEFKPPISERPQPIVAFAIDRNQAQDPKYLCAAFDNEVLACWHLQGYGPVDPLWTRQIFLERIRDDLPAVTTLAMNSVVLLVGGYVGYVVAYDALKGQPLRQVTSRMSRQVLDFRRAAQADSNRLWPITNLEIDPNPLQPQGILSVAPAVQYFDLGADHPRRNVKAPRHAAQAAAAASASNPHADLTADEINEEIELKMEMIQLDEQVEETQSHLGRNFSMPNMSEEEQLAYAVMLSNDPNMRDRHGNAAGLQAVHDDDLERALALSREDASSSIPGPSEPEPPVSWPAEPNGHNDLHEPSEPTGPSGPSPASAPWPHPSRSGVSAGDHDSDEELKRVLELSARETVQPPADDDFERQLQEALKQSLASP